tara:strand:+ start:951 stop:1259 length:309 start_codon:yes stop_codon:yes gene_type:complete
MKTYTFLIGAMDDFESLDELIAWCETDKKKEGAVWRNAQYFEFDVPEECDQDTVVMIGRGEAFSANWCMDDTFSCVIHGTLDLSGRTQTQMHDLWEIQSGTA